MRDRSNTFEAKLHEGKSHQQVIIEMAKSECERSPKNDIDDMFLQWIKMSNHAAEDYDSICDKPSMRLKDRMNQASNQVGQRNDPNDSTATPLWVILVASICSALVVIAIIIIFIIFSRRKAEIADGYKQMETE